MSHVVIILICLSLLVASFFIPPPATKVAFLDIGQGDSILLQAGTAQVLIDGGPGREVLTRLAEELPYFDRTIDVVIATHPDKDHLEGLLHVLEKYQVQLVILPPVPHTSALQEEWLRRLRDSVTAKNIAYRFAVAGQVLEQGDLRVTVLHPQPATSLLTSTTNNASVITRVDLGDLSLLLSGDAEAAIEKEVVARHAGSELDVQVLKAGHHGSKTSTGAELLAATTPRIVVVSAGKNNQFGHPHPTVLERITAAGAQVLRTDQVGTIRFILQDTQWLLSCGGFTNRQKSCTKQVEQF